MRRIPQQSAFTTQVCRTLPAVFLLSVAAASDIQAQTALDPATRAKEIAALAPQVEKKDLRKAEVKELDVVMRGVELILRANIEKLLDIWQFNEKDIPSVSRMRFMHRQAPEQIASALRPYGYYRSTVEASLHDLGTRWQAVYRIKPGDRVSVDKASVKISGEGADEPEFRNLQVFAEQNIKRGQVLDQELYENLKRSIQSAAAKLGYFDAEFLAQEILVDLESYSADVTLHFSTGKRYKIGDITLSQDVKWLSDDLLAKYVELEKDQNYDAGEIQRVQSDFSNTSYYRNVQVRASFEDAVDRVIPVSVDLTHRNPKQFVYGVGYGTDTGARARFGLTRRRVNRGGHHYELQANRSEIGFGVGASYTIPTLDPRTDSYGLAFSVEEENGAARNYRGVGIGGNFQFRDDVWIKTYALDYEFEENIGDDTTSTLLVPSLEWIRTSPFELENRINVYRGSWLKLDLSGGSNDVLSDTSFIQAQVSGRRIRTFDNGNRVIGRASIGATGVSDFSQLPVSRRFFTGGDRTTRGYGFENISPGDDDGGKFLTELSLELEVPFRPSFSWAIFGDLGDAFDDDLDLRRGIGAGLRWRSPIGPVRIDLARGLDEPSGGSYHLHFGIGPDL